MTIQLPAFGQPLSFFRRKTLVLKQIDYEINARIFDLWFEKKDRQLY
jgi:hypothetical protein